MKKHVLLLIVFLATFLQSAKTQALNFDGTNDYVNCGNAASLQLSTGTIECLLKTNTVSSGTNVYRALVVKQSAYGLFLRNNVLTVYNWGNSTFSSTGVNLVDNAWHHVVLSFQSGVTNGSKVYIDGVLSMTFTMAISNQNDPLFIGAAGGTSTPNNNQFFTGNIDEVRVWNRNLSQCEIQNNMSCELGSGQTGLVAYYQFNQSSGTSLPDASGNSNGITGTLTNFALTGATSNWVATGGVTTGTTCTTYTPYYTWTGATSTNWSTASNWSCDIVPTSANNVTIPNTTNAPTLPANQTIANLSLTGTNKIILGSSNLTVNAVTGGSPTAYIVTDGTGTLTIKNVGTTPTLFPIGPSQTVYAPATITNNVTRDFSVKVGTSITNPVTSYKYVNLQWDITPSVTTGNTATMILGWSSGSQASGFNPASATQVNHYNTGNSSWDVSYGASVSGSDPYTATVTGVSSFSPFTISNVVVLPVELLDFKGTPQYNSNLLTWTTANEVNNKGFQVERRQATGDSWDVLGFKTANNKAGTYDFTDNTPLSTSYYRLRQIDKDGKETLSKVVSVSNKGNNKLKVYPNPVSNVLTIETDFALARNEANRDFHIINLLGQQVISGKAAQRIDVSALPEGTYFLKVGTEQVKFVKQ